MQDPSKIQFFMSTLLEVLEKQEVLSPRVYSPRVNSPQLQRSSVESSEQNSENILHSNFPYTSIGDSDVTNFLPDISYEAMEISSTNIEDEDEKETTEEILPSPVLIESTPMAPRGSLPPKRAPPAPPLGSPKPALPSPILSHPSSAPVPKATIPKLSLGLIKPVKSESKPIVAPISSARSEKIQNKAQLLESKLRHLPATLSPRMASQVSPRRESTIPSSPLPSRTNKKQGNGTPSPVRVWAYRPRSNRFSKQIDKSNIAKQNWKSSEREPKTENKDTRSHAIASPRIREMQKEISKEKESSVLPLDKTNCETNTSKSTIHPAKSMFASRSGKLNERSRSSSLSNTIKPNLPPAPSVTITETPKEKRPLSYVLGTQIQKGLRRLDEQNIEKKQLVISQLKEAIALKTLRNNSLAGFKRSKENPSSN